MSSATVDSSLTSKDTSPKLWFDILPADTCYSIVRSVRGGDMISERTWDALLYLAESSATLRVVVDDVLPREFEFSYPADSESEQSANARWVTRLHSRLRKLELYPSRAESHQFPLQVFQAPQLLEADIPNHPSVIRALASCTSLRTLKVIVMHADLDDLWCTLRSLEIESLEFCCDVETLCDLPDSECPFLDSEHFTPRHNLLSEVCPTLKALSVECSDCQFVSDERMFNLPLWDMYRSLPGLRETRLWLEPPEDLIPQLQKMEAVAFGCLRYPCSFDHSSALEVGASVKEFHDRIECTAEEDKLSQLLSSCPNLSHLSLEVSFSAAHSLLDATQVLENLRHLHLHWGDSLGCRHGEPRCGAFHCYRDAAPGVLVSIVKVAVRVSDLQLMNVGISLSDIQAIFKHMGNRLVSFDMCVFGQGVPQHDYLEALLRYAAMYNPNFRSFVYKVGFPPHAALDDVQGRRLLAGLERLHRTAPSLETPSFKSKIEEALGA